MFHLQSNDLMVETQRSVGPAKNSREVFSTGALQNKWGGWGFVARSTLVLSFVRARRLPICRVPNNFGLTFPGWPRRAASRPTGDLAFATRRLCPF